MVSIMKLVIAKIQHTEFWYIENFCKINVWFLFMPNLQYGIRYDNFGVVYCCNVNVFERSRTKN